MAALKQFNSEDIIISPLEVNKSFTFSGADSLIEPNVGIDRFLGSNTNGLDKTGYISEISQSSIYHSIKHLYYSNYSVSSSGDPATLPTDIRGSQPEGDRIQGSRPYPNFENYLQL